MSAPYSFTGFYIALVVAILFNILGVIMAFVGASYIVTTPTVALNATITANNKTAADLLSFAAYIGIISIILLFIMWLIVFFLRSPVITASFTEADYYAARFGWGTRFLIFFEFIIIITAFILAIVGISYVNTSTNNAASANARFYGIIAAIAYIMIILPLIYIIYAVYEYNSYLYAFIMIPGVTKEVKGTALFSLNTNPYFPGTIIDSKVTVDTTYQPAGNFIYVDGNPVPSSTTSQPITKKDVFNYANGSYVPTNVAIPNAPTTTAPTTTDRTQVNIPSAGNEQIITTAPTTTTPFRPNRNANPFGTRGDNPFRQNS